jgi:hypothetical protein
LPRKEARRQIFGRPSRHRHLHHIVCQRDAFSIVVCCAAFLRQFNRVPPVTRRWRVASILQPIYFAISFVNLHFSDIQR